MKVIAPPGARCPMEHEPRRYITDDEAARVPATAYYRRLLRDGSLIIANEATGPDQIEQDKS